MKKITMVNLRLVSGRRIQMPLPRQVSIGSNMGNRESIMNIKVPITMRTATNSKIIMEHLIKIIIGVLPMATLEILWQTEETASQWIYQIWAIP